MKSERAVTSFASQPLDFRVLGAISVLILALSATCAVAQTQRCDLVGRDTVSSGGVTYKKCLDLADLDGKTVTVPSNVTRIDNDGLSLCKSAVQTGGNADIAYVYDNSGSMNASHYSVSSGDTTFYYGTGGCTNAGTGQPTANIMVWNNTGTAQVAKTVTRVASGAGCSNFAGDPYNARGRAFRLGLANQAQRAPQSTAGIMSFAASISNVRSPVPLSPANVTLLQNQINAFSGGSTNYTAPLDTSKRWLTTSITSNPSKAIIFLSDGRPDNTNYISLLDAAMPPIYGIFLGRDTVNTGRLVQMSALTGGQFFLIPPNRPDSLNAVVDRILKIVLLEYVPTRAVVRNVNFGPAQTGVAATEAAFTTQADGSWLMRLDSSVGLRTAAGNQITVMTKFREKNSSSVDSQSISFTLSTTGTAVGGIQIIDTRFAVVCYDRSQLRILNQAGLRPPYLSERDLAYRLRLRASPSELLMASSPNLTRRKNDAETRSLSTRAVFADSLVFTGLHPFRVIAGAAASGNDTLQSAQFDTVVASWVHPRDPQDFANDTLVVRAYDATAQAYFTAVEGGPKITQYPTTQARAYVVILDQTVDPRQTYTAVISSDRLGIDRETVTLQELSPGVLSGSIGISTAGFKNLADNVLQVSLGGDQLKVRYRDPVFGDSAEGTAGFDEGVQEIANLEFTDANGNVLAPDAVWPPSNGKLYLAYSDDMAGGNILVKQASLSLVNKRYGTVIGRDGERVTLDFDGTTTGTRGTWKGSIDLFDVFPASDSNGKAESRYRGEVTASVFTHDNLGNSQATRVTDFLLSAYPDSQAVIQWSLADSSLVPRGAEGLFITVRDQSFTVANDDSAQVTVLCLGSGDSVASLVVRENSPGVYASGMLVKNDSTPNPADRVLSCRSADQVVIRYVDPVFGTTAMLAVNEVAMPEADPRGRSFVSSEVVTLKTATVGAVIYYTVDGSTPAPGRSLVYTGPLSLTEATTLKAIAVKPGWKDSKVMVEVYTKQFVASRLEILDGNGNPASGGFLTGSNSDFRIKLTTTQANLLAVNSLASTQAADDSESINLGNSTFLGNSTEYWDNAPLGHNRARKLGNDTVEASGTDTLIASWRNPFNSQDFAADTVIIKPTFTAARVYFSLTQGGPAISEYPVNQDTVFVVVETRPRDPALAYSVSVTSNALGTDLEILPLTEVSPGKFSAKVDVSAGAVKAQKDGVLQVTLSGDQLVAVFTDPVYKDNYRGDAGFAQKLQASASLAFVDESGRVLAPAEFWDPSKGRVYLRYVDDWNPGIDNLVHEKTVRFVLVNKKAGQAVNSDSESVAITLIPARTDTNRGTWEGPMTLRDRFPTRLRNDTLETYFLGDLVASVSPHDNGGQSGGVDAKDSLSIAYPDKPADIVIREVGGKEVSRQTDKVLITLKDQIFSKSRIDTVTASVTCANTGDVVQKVVLVGDGNGNYVSTPPLNKGEHLASSDPVKSDLLLVCRDADVLIVTYVDPVYGTQRSADVRWSDDRPVRFYYASSRDSSEITSVSDGTDKDFLIMVLAKSPNRDTVDRIKVALVTEQGEKETFEAVETGAFTGKFVVKAPFAWGSGNPVDNNRTLEPRYNVSQKVNRVVAKGEATVAGNVHRADIALFSVFNLVTRAYIKDENEDGRADKAYFMFDRNLESLPSTLKEVYWNQVGSAFKREAGSSKLAFAPGGKTTVVADFSNDPFGENLTDIPSGQVPFALFPVDQVYGGQKPPLEDSVGPVPVNAAKKPSDMLAYNVSPTEKRFNPDTLEIQVSEKLKAQGDWSHLIRFSKGCVDYKESRPLLTFGEPYARPAVPGEFQTWVVVVDNSPSAQNPLVGDCIFLEADGRYTDVPGNRPGRLGVPLKGSDPKKVIQEFRGYPPVAGLSAGNPNFVVANNEVHKGSEGVWSSQGTNGSWDIIWLPPVGFDETQPGSFRPYLPPNLDPSSSSIRDAEVANPKHMPSGISAVQVISNGRYIAQISIFDNLGNFLRSSTQAFGYQGELRNPWRATSKGQVSFLVWDQRDKQGQLAGQGAYVWKVLFLFEDKKTEIYYTRTGIVRSGP